MMIIKTREDNFILFVQPVTLIHVPRYMFSGNLHSTSALEHVEGQCKININLVECYEGMTLAMYMM